MSQVLDDVYTLENVPLFEAIYGKGLISLGGYDAVDRMVEGLDLSDKTLLDYGSGIGGIPLHLAQNYNCHVIGFDIYSWMAEYCRQHVPHQLVDQVRFVTGAPGEKIPVESESVDLFYSKGVLTNIQDKGAVFREVNRILKPNGTLCLIDWVVPESIGPSSATLTTGEPSYKETASSYEELLNKAGYHQIEVQDLTSDYLQYVKTLHERLTSKVHKDKFSEIIPDDLREMLVKNNNKLLEDIESRQQSSVRIRASSC